MEALKAKCNELDGECRPLLQEVQKAEEMMQKESIIHKIETNAQQIKTEYEESEMGNETEGHYNKLLHLSSQNLEELRCMVSYIHVLAV